MFAHLRRVFVWGLCAWSISVPAAEGRRDYYVTGIFGGPDAGYVALIQLGDGNFRRLHRGDTFQGGTVVEITGQWVDLRSEETGATMRAYLKGAEPPPQATPEIRQIPAATSQRGSDAHMPEESSAPQDGSSAAGLRSAGAGKHRGKPGRQGQGEDLPSELPGGRTLKEVARELGILMKQGIQDRQTSELGTALAPLLGLPPGAEVTELGSGPPASFAQGIAYVERAAARGEPIRLTVESGGVRKRFMVLPSDTGTRVTMAPIGPAR
jgi:hypothetical protein